MRVFLGTFLWVTLVTTLGLSGAQAETGSVAASSAQVKPILIGQRVPEASVVDVDGKSVALRKLLAEKPTVLVVFRGGWCPYCNRQLAQLRLLTGVLNDAGWRIVGLSPDSPEALQKSTTDLKLDYTLYSDESADAIRALGLAVAAQPGNFGGAEGMKRWQERRSAKFKDAPPVLPVPGVFLVHRSGLVVYQYVNIQYSVRLSGEVLLSAAKAYAEAE